MKECSLEEAIELCKENGGRFTNKGKRLYAWFVHLPNGYIVTEDKGKRIELNSDLYKSTWIYEPPRQSAFQKWVKGKHVYAAASEKLHRFEGRKEGWNAALNKCIRILIEEDVNAILKKIEDLRES